MPPKVAMPPCLSIALAPPPGVHTVRYAGVFANRHHLRRAVAPVSTLPPPAPTQLALLDRQGRLLEPTIDDAPARPRRNPVWIRNNAVLVPRVLEQHFDTR